MTDRELNAAIGPRTGRRLLLGVVATLAGSGALLAGASAASAVTGFYIRGAGSGHGVGMSQYGAAGFAQHGYSYRQILDHYYEGTTLGQVSPGHQVRVLLKQGGAAFQGSNMKLGPKTRLHAALTYRVAATAKGLLVSDGGHLDGVWKSPLIIRSPQPLEVPGLGRYHGELEFVQNGSRVQTINIVGIEDYVRGVVAAEMPPSWPAQALEAQAVAARTFAVASAVSKVFTVYDDTRSQVYRGISAQTPASDAAVAATSGQIVEYDGAPALTYFFSSSGGHTESVQNVFQGVEPEEWLRGVADPYDDSFGNPYFRWKEDLTMATASRDLRADLRGSLRGIRILQRGVSPRIVRAAVVGSRGTVDVSGTQLETLFGLRSTYVSFTTITSRGVVSSGRGAATTIGAGTAAPTVSTPAGATTPAVSTTPPSSGAGGGVGAAPAPQTTSTPSVSVPAASADPGASARHGRPSKHTGSGAASRGARTGGGALAARRARASDVLTDMVRDDAATAAAMHATDQPIQPDGNYVSVAAAVPLLTWQPSVATRSASARATAAAQHLVTRAIAGSAYPARPGSVVRVQRAEDRRWRTVASGRVAAGGSYRVPVTRRGLYRVVLGAVDGPSVQVG